MQPHTAATRNPMTIFWLVKATPAWLALAPKGDAGRFAFVDNILKPILGTTPVPGCDSSTPRPTAASAATS